MSSHQSVTLDVLAALSKSGLLLQQDKRVHNVVTLVTGEMLSGSWWAHPKSHLVFAVLSELAEHRDVLFTKLLYGKVTLVHRQLWPAFLAVALERAPWQLKGLSRPARTLLASIEDSRKPVASTGRVVKELEVRLLAHTQQVHTESGHHEMSVQSWSQWARQMKTKSLRSATAARKQLEESALAIGADAAGLPWTPEK